MLNLLLMLSFTCVVLGQPALPPLPPVPDVGIFFEPGLEECTRIYPNGTTSTISYDPCISFCCGGAIVPSNSSYECCGSESEGSPYLPSEERCCKWWTGVGKAYPNREMWGYGCCGAEKIRWHGAGQACCYGDGGPPSVFKWETEICCNSHPVPKGGRSNPQCCGVSAAYDPRTESCPCNDGTVLPAPQRTSGCCEGPGGSKMAYNVDTQFCCSGQIGRIDVDFCCGGDVEVIGQGICCNDVIVPVVPPNKNMTSCCDSAPYNPKTHVCCQGDVIPIEEGADQCCGGIPYNPLKSVCCVTSLWSVETEGTECCGSNAYFPDDGRFCCDVNDIVYTSSEVGGDVCCGDNILFFYKDEDHFICCNGYVNFKFEGDQCCGNSSYFKRVSICCDGNIFNKAHGNACCHGKPYLEEIGSICCENGSFGPFGAPACCGGDGYDKQRGSICCDSEITTGLRWPACCKNKGYDALTHACCGGMISMFPADTPESKRECCGSEAYNKDRSLCCDGVVMNKTYSYNSQCCGHELYDDTQKICCKGEGEPILYDRLYGPNSQCCDTQLFNSSAQFCCDGYLRDKEFDQSGCCAGIVYDKTKHICCHHYLKSISENVPWEFAECCGFQCFYREKQKCCYDRIYQNNERTNVTCSDF